MRFHQPVCFNWLMKDHLLDDQTVSRSPDFDGRIFDAIGRSFAARNKYAKTGANGRGGPYIKHGMCVVALHYSVLKFTSITESNFQTDRIYVAPQHVLLKRNPPVLSGGFLTRVRLTIKDLSQAYAQWPFS